MVNGAKLQMQGIISKSDTLAALAGKISSILKCVEGSFTAEAMAYLEQYLTAEKGSRFLEAVRKLEKELGDKMPQLDTAKAKRIVESLDDGKSVDDVVAELKKWCESVISEADRLKLAGWKYKPSDELYLKYKNVFDNPKYYNQKTGAIRWPADDGFLAGSKIDKIIKKDTIFKRYGNNKGSFLGNTTDSYASRAMAPSSENAEVRYYRLLEDCEMTTGKAAPWFESEGGAEQFVKYTADGGKYSIEELEGMDLLEDITELVEKGEIKID